MARASVAITAEDKLSPGLLAAKKSMMQFQQTATKVGDAIKSAFAVTAVVAGLKKLADSAADAFKAFNEAERKYKQLQITLGNGTAYKSVVDNINRLKTVTLSSKDDIEGMVSELAGLGKSADEINKISEAAVALSNVTGKDLNSTMTALLNTYNGTTTSLKKMGIDTSELTKAELAQGAAVDLVIDKFSELSKAMAADDSSQRLKNIKDNLGDIKQSLGGIVDTAVSPLLQKLETFTGELSLKVKDFSDNARVVISNLPEILKRLGTAIKESLGHLFTVDGFKALVEGIYKMVIAKIKLLGNAIADLAQGISGVLESVLKGVGNYAMYWVTHIADSLGINISEVVNNIGNWLLDSPIGKFIDNILSKVINGIKLIGNIIKNIPGIIKIVVNNIGTIISSLFENIPKAIGQLFVGLGNKIAWLAVKLKNDFLQSIEDLVNGAGDKLQGTWLGKMFGLGKGMSNFSIGVDRTSELNLAANSDSAFSNMRGYFGNIGEDLAPMMKEIENLLNPAFEKWTADNSTTIGAVMAKWTAKSTDEYLEAAKDNFSDIGSFLKDWGKNFMGDLGEGWDEISATLAETFSGTFGDSFDVFVDWFKTFVQENRTNEGGSDGGTGGGGKKDDDTSQMDAFRQTTLENFKGSLGKAGEVADKLANNMSTMGPLLGAIATALEYVFQGLSETLGPALDEITNAVILPLVEVGKSIGRLVLPIIKTLTPILQGLGKVIVGVVAVFEWVGQLLTHWAASFVNAFTWITGFSMYDPGGPGNIVDFVSGRVNEFNNSMGGTDSASTQTAISSASYRGATSVTINIYQQAPVVGDNGMRQFAQMIKDEFEALDYYGVTA